MPISRRRLRDEHLTTTRSAHVARRRVQGSTDLAAGHGLYDWTQRDAAEVLAARDSFIAARLRDAHR